MNVVVGEPVTIRKISSQEDIDYFHALYIKKVKKLYYKYNSVYGNPKTKLVIE